MKPKPLLLAITLLATTQMIVLGLQINQIHSEYTSIGWYQNGNIKIKAWKTHSYEEYHHVALHEYGHHDWQNYKDKEFHKEWEQAIIECGYISEYAKSFKTTRVRTEEDYADTYSVWKRNGTICQTKLRLLEE